MSYHVSPNVSYLHPYDAISQIEIATMDIAQEMGLAAWLTSPWRLARHAGDKSLHRMDCARDYDFHYPTNMGGGRVNDDTKDKILVAYRARLPSKWFDCVNEGDHFHLEYDPKA